MSGESGFVRLSDGGRISFSLRGERDAPVLLLNRPLGGSMTLWGQFADRLAAHLRVLSFDPRGVGGSSDAPLLHSTRAMARDAAELLDQLGIERAHVFGLSLGAMVAACLAVAAPARIRSLLLASAIPAPDALSLRGAAQLASLALALARSRTGVEAEVTLVRRILSREFRATQPERVLEIERGVRRSPSTLRNLAALVLAAARHSQRLDRVPASVPALLLFGELDQLAGPEVRAELKRELPSAEQQVIPGAGHDLSLEEPAETAARVLGFLRR